MAWSIFTDGGGNEVAVGWADQLLKLIGAPVSPGNETFIYQWEMSEGGGGKYNPLNQGPVPGNPTLTTTGQQYGGGAADYASWQAGLIGAADYLAMPAYAGVKSALIANDPEAAKSALWASPWAASHYGYGASWSNAVPPGGTPIAPGGAGDVSLTGASTAIPGSAAIAITVPLVGPVTLLSKSQARGLIGGMLILAGGLIALPGLVVLLVAVGGPGARAAGQVQRIPVAGKLAGAGVAAL